VYEFTGAKRIVIKQVLSFFMMVLKARLRCSTFMIPKPYFQPANERYSLGFSNCSNTR
jgi:hypothetical protein